MTAELSPGLILILGGLLAPLLPARLRPWLMVVLPVLAFVHLLGLSHGEFGRLQVMGLSLVTLRVDGLSLLFGYIFLIAAFLGGLFALHVRGTVQHSAALIYAGSALGAVFAGDLVTLFFFWEGIAAASVFLIWAARTERAYRAGMRYIAIQIGSGVLLLSGILIHYRQTGSIGFGAIGLGSPGGSLILLAIGIKCAFPLLHNWLQDAYPEATVSGTVLLSSFTTKVAVYALARGFAGTEILVPIGAVMTLFPIFYAVMENDLRRVLAYSLNNQLGFMVVGIGIGTELALNGAVAHAFADILFKGLLFMSMGAVLFRVGTAKASELGGLYKSMPWTTGFCIVGAASISAFPLFSGFVTKSMVIAAAMEGGYFWTWLAMIFASAGVLHHAGIKIPFFAFFHHDSGKRCAEAPFNMLLAMGIAAVLCILIGSFPRLLYSLLPYKSGFVPYTVEHVATQLQLLMFAVLAFTVMMRTHLHPPEVPSTNLDFDWFYRKPGRALAFAAGRLADRAWRGFAAAGTQAARRTLDFIEHAHGPGGILARAWTTGSMALWTTIMLAAYLLLASLR
jgi:multicomponent Na+:H+ antiporter subunit D